MAREGFEHHEQILRVGGLWVPWGEAADAVRRYLTSHDETFAFPHYDLLTTTADPDVLVDGDLLAPVLLNAAPTIRGFAGLKAQ